MLSLLLTLGPDLIIIHIHYYPIIIIIINNGGQVARVDRQHRGEDPRGVRPLRQGQDGGHRAGGGRLGLGLGFYN